ncbi:MAG: restriction endonuclease subunit S [Candidatus Thiodiazotropha sp.]
MSDQQTEEYVGWIRTRRETMEYKRYPTYKNSSVAWLTEIPKHWDESIISALFEDNKHKNKDSSEQNLLSLSYGRIINKDINTEEGLLPASFETYQIVEPDYIVLRLTDLQNDQRSLRVGHVQDRGIITSAYTALKKKSFRMASARYFYYLLHAYDLMKVFYGMGAGVRQSLGYDELKKTRLFLPAKDEQQCIVRFLDRETTRIDALIEKKQRLIELLKEKRQAVITQAVTKGLDPSVPMKDSGVEWLGEVPEHWFVGRLGYYGLVNNGTTPSKANDEYWFDGDVPWLSSGVVNQETVLTPSEYITHKALTECSVKMLPVGTVIVGMIGQGKTRGMSAILAVSATINQNLAAVVTDNRLSSYYLHYVFKAAYESIRNVGRGGNQAALNCEILSDMKIPVPEYDEQVKIVDAIKSRISKIDVVVEQSERSLSLLKEHRSALITAAVTGQIDVRNLA